MVVISGYFIPALSMFPQMTVLPADNTATDNLSVSENRLLSLLLQITNEKGNMVVSHWANFLGNVFLS